MVRNAEETRSKLVHAAYEQMHAHGYQGLRVDQVLKQTQLQKGAFYHHFSSKIQLGYAVVEEEIEALLESVWLNQIRLMNNPVKEIPELLETFSERATPLMKEHGCPLNNLAQEMSNLDEGFNQRIKTSFELWINTLAEKLEEAKTKKFIRNDINSQVVSRFIIAIIEGCISINKVEKTNKQFTAGISQLRLYLLSLKP